MVRQSDAASIRQLRIDDLQEIIATYTRCYGAGPLIPLRVIEQFKAEMEVLGLTGEFLPMAIGQAFPEEQKPKPDDAVLRQDPAGLTGLSDKAADVVLVDEVVVSHAQYSPDLLMVLAGGIIAGSMKPGATLADAINHAADDLAAVQARGSDMHPDDVYQGAAPASDMADALGYSLRAMRDQAMQVIGADAVRQREERAARNARGRREIQATEDPTLNNTFTHAAGDGVALMSTAHPGWEKTAQQRAIEDERIVALHRDGAIVHLNGIAIDPDVFVPEAVDDAWSVARAPRCQGGAMRLWRHDGGLLVIPDDVVTIQILPRAERSEQVLAVSRLFR